MWRVRGLGIMAANLVQARIGGLPQAQYFAAMDGSPRDRAKGVRLLALATNQLPRPSKPPRGSPQPYIWLRLKPFPRLTPDLHDDQEADDPKEPVQEFIE